MEYEYFILQRGLVVDHWTQNTEGGDPEYLTEAREALRWLNTGVEKREEITLLGEPLYIELRPAMPEGSNYQQPSCLYHVGALNASPFHIGLALPAKSSDPEKEAMEWSSLRAIFASSSTIIASREAGADIEVVNAPPEERDTHMGLIMLNRPALVLVLLLAEGTDDVDGAAIKMARYLGEAMLLKRCDCTT